MEQLICAKKTFKNYADFNKSLNKYSELMHVKYVTCKSERNKTNLKEFNMKLLKCDKHQTDKCESSIRICFKKAGPNANNYMITRMCAEHTHSLRNISLIQDFNSDSKGSNMNANEKVNIECPIPEIIVNHDQNSENIRKQEFDMNEVSSSPTTNNFFSNQNETSVNISPFVNQSSFSREYCAESNSLNKSSCNSIYINANLEQKIQVSSFISDVSNLNFSQVGSCQVKTDLINIDEDLGISNLKQNTQVSSSISGVSSQTFNEIDQYQIGVDPFFYDVDQLAILFNSSKVIGETNYYGLRSLTKKYLKFHPFSFILNVFFNNYFKIFIYHLHFVTQTYLKYFSVYC